MKFKRLSQVFSAVLLSLSSLFVLNVGHAFAATATWDGGGSDSNFSTAANWVGDTVPTDGDSLVFPAVTSAAISTTNDLLTSVSSIVVQDGSSNPNFYPVSIYDDGSPSTLSIGGSIVVGNNQNLIITHSVTLTSNTTVTLSNSDSSFSISGPTIALGANSLSFLNANNTSLTTSSNSSELPSVTFGGATSGLTGSTGSKIVATGVNLDWQMTGSVYQGDVELTNTVMSFDDTAVFGDTTGGIKVTNSQLKYSSSSATTINDSITISGNLFGLLNKDVKSFGNESLAVWSSGKVTLAGTVTLLTDTMFDPYGANVEITGPLSGQHLISASRTYTPDANKGHIIISSSANTSLLPNGDYLVASDAAPITDSLPTQDIIVLVGETVIVNGQRGKVIVSPNGKLKGSGTVGSVSLLDTATLSPGQSPGCINTGNLTFVSGSAYEFELGGTTACTGYDQTLVTGTVTLGNGSLSTILYGGFKPSAGQTYTIISNDGNDAISGTFNGLVEGATFTVSGYVFKISYVGGTGNDVVLTVQSVPAVPSTGFAIITTNPLATLAATVILTTALIVLSRRYNKLYIKK